MVHGKGEEPQRQNVAGSTAECPRCKTQLTIRMNRFGTAYFLVMGAATLAYVAYLLTSSDTTSLSVAGFMVLVLGVMIFGRGIYWHQRTTLKCGNCGYARVVKRK